MRTASRLPLVLHGIGSIFVGLLYGAMASHVRAATDRTWGADYSGAVVRGCCTRLCSFSILYLQGRIDWIWFMASQISVRRGRRASSLCDRSESQLARICPSLYVRGIEAPGVIPPREGKKSGKEKTARERIFGILMYSWLLAADPSFGLLWRATRPARKKGSEVLAPNEVLGVWHSVRGIKNCAGCPRLRKGRGGAAIALGQPCLSSHCRRRRRP